MANLRRLALFIGALLPAAFAAPTAAAGPKKEVIPGKYIVTLKEGISSDAVDSHLSWVSNVHKRSLSRRDTVGVEKTYGIGEFFNGYAGEFDDATLEEIKNNPDVSPLSSCSFPPFTQQQEISVANQDAQQNRSSRLRRTKSGTLTSSRRSTRSTRSPSAP